jgi:hypothetical protein
MIVRGFLQHVFSFRSVYSDPGICEGSTKEEIGLSFPGDKLVWRPDFNATRELPFLLPERSLEMDRAIRMYKGRVVAHGLN